MTKAKTKQVDLYVVIHDVEQIGRKPAIYCVSGKEKAEYEKATFDQLLDKILEKPEPNFDQDQLSHFKAVQEYRQKVLNDKTGKDYLEIVCYDAQQKDQNRVVDGVRTQDMRLRVTDIIQPYIIRDQKTKANEAYDKLEMIVAYNPAC